MRRLAFLIAAIAGLSLVASPVVAATSTYHIQAQASGLGAYFSNVVPDEQGNLEPGEYAETWIDASSSIVKRSTQKMVCIGHTEFTVDPEGTWEPGLSFNACGEFDSLTFDRNLAGGHLVASLPVEVCVSWDEYGKECLEFEYLGDVDIDLALTADGSLQRFHETDSGGIAGSYQFCAHGTGLQRHALPEGSIDLDGTSLLGSGTWSQAWMFQVRQGYVEIVHG